MSQLTLPRDWNKRVQSAILQAISLGRHCLFLIVGRMARSPNAFDRVVAENERLRHEVVLHSNYVVGSHIRLVEIVVYRQFLSLLRVLHREPWVTHYRDCTYDTGSNTI